MIQAGQTALAEDFINSTENAGTSADNGKVPKLEQVGGEDGKLSKEFIKFDVPVVRVYTNSATWTKPAGLKYILVEVQAGGGGGNSVSAPTSTNTNVTNGAGAGGYCKKLMSVANLSSTESVVVGAGGSAGNNGGNSSFGSHLTAYAGLADKSGGSASGGDINISGQPGDDGAIEYADGSSKSVGYGGMGGDSFLGKGGTNFTPGQGRNGSAGTGYGAGGAGGASDYNDGAKSGGAGAPGIVIVTEFYN